MTARAAFPRCGQRGVALVCALFLMLATSIVAMSVARMALASLSSAERERDRAVARAAAEAALRDGERDAAAGGAEVDAGAGGSGCGAGAPASAPCGEPDPPAWQALDLAAPGDGGVTAYGAATGARMAVGGPLLPARLPAYLVERLAPAVGASAVGTPAQGAPPAAVFRITAIGFGTRAATRVVLQSLYRKAAPAPAPGASGAPVPAPSVPAPAGRIAWRDIGNWPELHARAAR